MKTEAAHWRYQGAQDRCLDGRLCRMLGILSGIFFSTNWLIKHTSLVVMKAKLFREFETKNCKL